MSASLSNQMLLRGGLTAAAGVAFLATSCLLATSLPPIEASDLEMLRQFPPQSVQQLVQSRDVLLRYAAAAPVFVLTSYSLLYIGMQSCAIPGTLVSESRAAAKALQRSCDSATSFARWRTRRVMRHGLIRYRLNVADAQPAGRCPVRYQLGHPAGLR